MASVFVKFYNESLMSVIIIIHLCPHVYFCLQGSSFSLHYKMCYNLVQCLLSQNVSFFFQKFSKLVCQPFFDWYRYKHFNFANPNPLYQTLTPKYVSLLGGMFQTPKQ